MSVLANARSAAPAKTLNSVVRVLLAATVTVAILSFVSWLEAWEAIGFWPVLGIALWVVGVLATLSATARFCEALRLPTGAQLVLLAVGAGAASAVVTVASMLFARAYPDLVYGGAVTADAPDLDLVALRAFFEGDALFGFWALLVELPRRIAVAQSHERERRALRHEAELLRVRASLEPHFVLNTLNTIAGLVVAQPREARELIGELGELLRESSVQIVDAHHTVHHELRWLRRFTAILEARHHGRLRFEWFVDDNVSDLLFPAMLLQPLVENAVQHGALQNRTGGLVTIRVLEVAGDVRCEVEDNGPGPATSTASSAGRGLALVRQRLELEQDGARFELRDTDAGTVAVVHVPGRRS